MTPIGSPSFVATMLIVTGLLAGCASPCLPQEVPTQVRLDLAGEAAHTLPILSSGATTVVGQEVPDAHGRLEVVLDVAHEGNDNASLAFDDVAIRGLRLTLLVAGEPVPVDVVRVEGGHGWSRAGDNQWDGAAVSGSRLVLWWTVDRELAPTAAALVLDEGAAYEAIIDFDWLHESCVARASGHLRQNFRDVVEASVSALADA